MGFYTTDERAAVLDSCQENPYPPSKNRVWNFFTTSETCAGFFESQPVESHWEKLPTPTKPVSGMRYYGYRLYIPAIGRWLSRDPLEELGGLHLYCFVHNDSLGRTDALGLLDSVTVSFWEAMATGSYAEAAAILEIAEGAIAKETLVALSAALAAAVASGNLVKHLDIHIQSVMDACPGLSPDPNDPNQGPVKGWIKEIKAAIQNLKQQLKHTPKNKLKQKPLEDAIKKGEEFLKKVEEAASKPCPSCEVK